MLRTLSKSIIFCCLLLLMLPAGCIEQEEEFGSEVEQKAPAQEPAGPVLSPAAVLAEPEKYLGREITVSGTVAAGLAFEFVSEQPYLLAADGAELWVITKEVLPPEHETITVRGKLVSPYQIKGRQYELALLEEERLR